MILDDDHRMIRDAARKFARERQELDMAQPWEWADSKIDFRNNH